MPLSHARQLVRWGGLLASLAALVVSGVFIWHAGDKLPMSAELTIFIAFVLGGSGLLIAWIGWRTLRLANPKRAIASWRVSDPDWQRFREACRMRERMPGALPGSVPLDLVVPAQGVEVVALPKGFRVGDAFHELGTLGAELLDARVVDSPVHMLEFNVVYATGKTSSVRRGVRIPMAGGEAWIKQVEDHWVAREPLLSLDAAQLLQRERAGFRMAIGGLALFLAVVGVFAFTNPPGWAALAPISAFVLACIGFFRGMRASLVRSRRSG